VKDPWLHELRVHLYSRDKNEQRVREQIENPKPDYASKVSKMIHEDMILWKYYPVFMEKYHQRPDIKFQKEVAPRKEPGVYHSPVSDALITKVSLRSIWLIIISLVAALWAMAIIAGKRSSHGTTT
jgi:hypothetical protein